MPAGFVYVRKDRKEEITEPAKTTEVQRQRKPKEGVSSVPEIFCKDVEGGNSQEISKMRKAVKISWHKLSHLEAVLRDANAIVLTEE